MNLAVNIDTTFNICCLHDSYSGAESNLKYCLWYCESKKWCLPFYPLVNSHSDGQIGIWRQQIVFYSGCPSRASLKQNNKHEAEQSFDPDGIVPSHPCLRVLCEGIGPDCRGSQESILIHHRHQ